MENFNDLNIAMLISNWIKYIFWIIILSGILFASIIGWKRNKIKGFLFIFISSCLSLVYHLPSIYFKGYYAIRRYTPAELGELMIKLSYVDLIVIPIIAVLLVIGLFYIALKKN